MLLSLVRSGLHLMREIMSYKVRPQSKLSARWSGPYEVIGMDANKVSLRDLTGGPNQLLDVSRLKPFIADHGVDPKALATADLVKPEVVEVLSHRGSP